MLKVPVLALNYRNISSLTLVQKIIPGYLQRPVDNYSRAYLWLISHDLSHGVPLMDPPRFYDLDLLYTRKVGHTDLDFVNKCRCLTGVYIPNIKVMRQIVLEI
jgi:hypothetical protein